MEYDIESILEMYEDDYNPRAMVPGPRNMDQEPRIPFGDGSITPVRNKSKNIVGKNLKLLEEGKLYHLRLGANKKVYFGTKKELETIFKNRKTSGGDVMARLEDVKNPKGYLTQKQFQEFLKKNNINAESSGSSFSKNHGVNTKVNPLQKKRKKIQDIKNG